MSQIHALKTRDARHRTEAAILPAEKTQAVQHLIKLTHGLIDLAEREAQKLARNDMVSFSILQDEKGQLAENYAKASEEFRKRLAEFRGMNPALLDRLETAQKRLGDVSSENNTIVTRLYERSKKKAQDDLDDANDIQSKTKVNFANTNQDEAATAKGAKNA